MWRSASGRSVRHPQFEVLAAVAGRGVDEAGAGIFGDVIAGEEGDGEGVIGTPEMHPDLRRDLDSPRADAHS